MMWCCRRPSCKRRYPKKTRKSAQKRWAIGRSLGTQETMDKKKSQHEERRDKYAGSEVNEVDGEYRATDTKLSGKMKDDDESNKRAMVVAVASAAAAEAAMAAAHAAAEVVRLTGAAVYRSKHEWAAHKIQTTFRGYLARQALRALKGLVRLQALVRGRYVRRQATSTLHCMEALARAQARANASRVLLTDDAKKPMVLQRQQKPHAPPPRKSLDTCKRGDWDDNVTPLEVVQAKLESKHEAAIRRERAIAYASTHQTRAYVSKSETSSGEDGEYKKLYWGWNWLERWVASHPWESRATSHANNNRLDYTKLRTNTGRHISTVLSPIPNPNTKCSPKPNTKCSPDHSTKRSPSPNTKYSPNPSTKCSPNPTLRHKQMNNPKKVEDEEEDRIRKGRSTHYSPKTPAICIKPGLTTRNVSMDTRSASLRSWRGVDIEEPTSAATGNSAVNMSRRSKFSSRQSIASSTCKDGDDDDSLASSTLLPNYMTATESARAKFRSHSTPKQRSLTPPHTPTSTASSAACVRKRLSFPLPNHTAAPATATAFYSFQYRCPERSPGPSPSPSLKDSSTSPPHNPSSFLPN